VILRVHPTTPQERQISRAVETLRRDGVIVYPTDTVYGIGCSVFSSRAIERVYALKRQEKSKPFSFLCSDLSNISEYAKVSNTAFRLMKQLVPGPFTFVLPAGRLKQLPKSLISKRKAVGIRVPDNTICRALIKELGHPILGASATNSDGEVLNDPAQIAEEYGERIDLLLDGGMGLLEVSTIIDLTEDRPVIVRQGAGAVNNLIAS
jgi:tRNA threonylcarbamoyl adenosine modification protein (Sua5/YciO/YrdC/YwlC family)